MVKITFGQTRAETKRAGTSTVGVETLYSM